MKPKRPAPSPSLHEQVVDRHFATDPITGARLPDAAIEALRDTMAAGRAAAERAARVADAILANEMETLPARHRRAREETWRIAEPVLRRFDDALAGARRVLAEIERTTSAPPGPRDAASAVLASEIRTRLAALPPESRRKVMRDALEAGDDALHAAVLGGPAMLSGMEAAELAIVRAAWAEARHGEATRRARRLTAALEDADRGGALLVSYTTGLADAAIVEAAEATEKAVSEAMAS